jgi:hypothetical protein
MGRVEAEELHERVVGGSAEDDRLQVLESELLRRCHSVRPVDDRRVLRHHDRRPRVGGLGKGDDVRSIQSPTPRCSAD